MPEEHWRTVGIGDPAPIFLHESYRSTIEKWAASLPDAAAEVTIVGMVRNAVMQLVDSRLAADSRALPVSSTVTSTEPTPQGAAIVGRCVVVEPATA